MDRTIDKAMPIFIVEMPERRLSDHGETADKVSQSATVRTVWDKSATEVDSLSLKRQPKETPSYRK